MTILDFFTLESAITKFTKLAIFKPVFLLFPLVFLVTVCCSSPPSASFGYLSVSNFCLVFNGCLRPPVCVFDPSLKELIDASNAAGLQPNETEEQVRFPKRPYVRSGYIVLPKTEKKTTILEKISQKLVSKRAKQSKK